MRLTRLALATCAAAVALAAPAGAAPPDPDNVVTVTENPPVNCVTFPCPQPPPYTVCVVPAGLCTPQ